MRTHQPQPHIHNVLPVTAVGGLLFALLLSACAQAPIAAATPVVEPAQAVPLMSAPCVKKVPQPYKWEGYNDKPMDACLGPTHYRIPANLFRDQMGPDFQAGISLVVMWPDLQAAAPGKLNGQPLEQVAARVHISPDHVDRVPIETLLERSISRKEYQSADDPSAVLELRDRQPERFGLTPYFVNPTLFWAYQTEEAQRFGHKVHAKLENAQDWYLHRDATGRLTTVIRCSSHLKPDGYVIHNQTLKNDLASTAAQCNQTFVMEDVKASVRISFSRVLLKDWKRFEDRARELFEQHRVR